MSRVIACLAAVLAISGCEGSFDSAGIGKDAMPICTIDGRAFVVTVHVGNAYTLKKLPMKCAVQFEKRDSD